MSELELLKSAQNNDQRAFKEIFIKCKSPIFYTIYQMVNDTDLAEDLTMETFEKAFRDIKKFVPNYKLVSWITKIGKNHTLDYIRRQNVRPKHVELDYMLQDHYTPEAEYIGKEQEGILQTALTHLNGNYRKITMMRMEGKKCKDIAEELNIPINTVVGYIRVSKKKILKEQDKVCLIKTEKPKAERKTREELQRINQSIIQIYYQKKYRENQDKLLAQKAARKEQRKKYARKKIKHK